MTDFTKLIPELPNWNNGKGIDVESWIGCMGNYQLAIGYTTLFWPRFVEFEDFVLREGFSMDSLRGFQSNCTSRGEIESVMNHFHISAFHFNDLENHSVEQAMYLGGILREIHRCKLAWQFPDRQFEVHFDTPDKSDLMEYQLWFHQIDNHA